ncbi:MAG: [protein-PII] uridylyltransferase [Streptosporangiales bacterium]|nr:[protein-PII] uridylyltransferase [Streptosporangiales bacterium]
MRTLGETGVLETSARTSYAAARATRAAAVDEWLARLLGLEPEVALVAVGGYGRRELAPASDLDLLLLHRGGSRDEDGVRALAQRVWYPIWDSGLPLDHSVRTTEEARAVARSDLKVALGLLNARHVAGDPQLTALLRETVLADWRAGAAHRLPEVRAAAAERAERHGELAFLLEPELKEARGGLRDVHAIHAVAAAWVAEGPGARVREAYEFLLDVRHALHEVTGRAVDRLVLQEQDAVARAVGLNDADVLLRALAEAGRRISYACDLTWRSLDRFLAPRERRRRPRTGRTGGGVGGRQPVRRPLARDVVEQEGEAVLARDADPLADPTLILRAAAAAAQAGLPIAPATIETLATRSAPLPVPWPEAARDALVALLGAGRSAIPVWEALDQSGVIVELIPDWERVRNRPQRSPVHTFTVDRHLVEAAAAAAAFTREVARPDLLLLAALLHDIGKGWPGDHSRTGETVARDVGARIGLAPPDIEILAGAVRYHLLLPQTATRRDLDDPATVEFVARAVGSHELLDILFALAIADGHATGPGAWNEWKAGLVADLVRRVDAVLAGEVPPPPPPLGPEQVDLARCGGPAVHVDGAQITVVAPDRPGLLWRAAGVLALHRMVIRAATAASYEASERVAVTVFTAAPEYGTAPDARLLGDDLRRALAGRLDVAERLEKRRQAYQPRPGIPVPPPRVTLLDDASHTATVVEVRAHDRPGLLWRIGRALGEAGLDIRSARVETLGAEAVDVFYVVDGSGSPITDSRRRAAVRRAVLDAVR